VRVLTRKPLRALPAWAWVQLALAIAAAVLLLRFPLQIFPIHDVSIAALPVLALALLAGPLAGLLAAAATAVAAVLMGSATILLGLLLLAAPVLGLAHSRLAHPAYGCFIAPIATSIVAALLDSSGADRLHLATIGMLQSSVNVILAFGIALLIASGRPYRQGGWAGRPLTHRLFVILATVATLLTAGLGLLSTISLQQRSVANTLSNVHLLAQEIAETTQVQLRGQGRSLAAFGRSLVQSDLTVENDDLSRRIEAYTTGQSELLTVLLARTDGIVIAAAATRPTLDVRGVMANDVSDRDYFRGAVAQGAPYVTDTFMGRGFGSDIIVAVSAPIYRERSLAGVIEGSLNLVQVAQVLDSASSRRGLDIVLVDRANRVVAARGAVCTAGSDLLPHRLAATPRAPARSHRRSRGVGAAGAVWLDRPRRPTCGNPAPGLRNAVPVRRARHGGGFAHRLRRFDPVRRFAGPAARAVRRGADRRGRLRPEQLAARGTRRAE
jgi:hypothetical protein